MQSILGTDADSGSGMSGMSGMRGMSVAAYEGGQYIIASQGLLMLSRDCVTWEKVDMSHANFERGTSYGWINSFLYANGFYICGGGDGKAAYSTDARHWTPIPQARRIFHNFHFINGLAYGNGTFVAVGATCAASPCPNPFDSIEPTDHSGDAGCIAYIPW
jgi:hypothetical protein